MFRRDLYRAMASVLDALDADALARTSFRFGGGTCLALGHGEYRISLLRGVRELLSDLDVGYDRSH